MDCELLPLVEVAELLGVRHQVVRSYLQDHTLLASVGTDKVRRIPRCFLDEHSQPVTPVAALRGTAILLLDGGMSEAEAVEWLLAENDSLGTSPIAALRAGRVHEVRRVAACLAL